MTQSSHSGSCLLAMEDGAVFVGRPFGAPGTFHGEAVFNTSMTGYQEILTDPSYCGQIVTMTYPHIGNYGVNDADLESARPFVAGFAVREICHEPSNYRSTRTLEAFLRDHGILGITGIDTRALTRRIRTAGAMRAVITTEIADPAEAVAAAASGPSMAGSDLVCRVAPDRPSTWSEGLPGEFIVPRGGAGEAWRVVAIDCGMKRNILRHLVDIGASVRVVPPTMSAEELLEDQPDGVFVSNGPGDPAAVGYATELLRGLSGRVPIFGICLGHQLLSLALGASSFKLPFGHRGGNQPVLNTATGRVEITSQNHGFAIEVESLERAGGIVTHLNLNDRTLEGFAHPDQAMFAVQYHPEASPGPHDATYLFDCFREMVRTGHAPTGEQMAQAQAALQNRRHPTV